ncbi:hypothetical protein THAOC_09415 [Thalassiosira oceanica]|uniref:Uncharacterized protein n=1 Tax=Thalassiosira oceanica TaxID=159749 RepID=K0SWJ6_THAOC|nr:hypothetical protein THAOC_09415 [Thalassiosira oceanica]|eukprot:EJK69339.1 hypothetical protein THAOC_09415 [Thalassiosira oceanica]
MGFHARSRIFDHAYRTYENKKKLSKTWRPWGKANCSSATSLNQTAVGNIESRCMDDSIPSAAPSDICKSKLEREANQQRCRRGATEEPDIDIWPEGGVDGPRWTDTQRLSDLVR